MSDPELLPCPFCSSAPLLAQPEEDDYHLAGYRYECGDCGAHRYEVFPDAAAALVDWNRRPEAEAVTLAQVERVLRALGDGIRAVRRESEGAGEGKRE